MGGTTSLAVEPGASGIGGYASPSYPLVLVYPKNIMSYVCKRKFLLYLFLNLKNYINGSFKFNRCTDFF
jgi:hypothetical protein